MADHLSFTGNIGLKAGTQIELRQSQKGTPWCSFPVMWSGSKRDQTGEWVNSEPFIVDVIAYDALAQAICETMYGGMRVNVSGRATPDTWHSDQGPRTTIKLQADFVAPDIRRNEVDVRKRESQSQQQESSWGGASSTGGFTQDDQPPF